MILKIVLVDHGTQTLELPGYETSMLLLWPFTIFTNFGFVFLKALFVYYFNIKQNIIFHRFPS